MPNYTGPERREVPPQSWHLKKEVNLSMILSIIGVAIACVTGYTDLRREMALIQADARVLHQAITRNENELEKAIALLQSHYLRMEGKLDRLIERGK